MEIYYLAVNVKYLHENGYERTLRFSHCSNSLNDMLKYLRTKSDYQDLKIITITKEDYVSIMERRN